MMLNVQKGSERIDFDPCRRTVVRFEGVRALKWEKELGTVALNGPLSQIRSKTFM